MDWEPIVAVAQIATGLATLIVAIFLAGQLSLQRRALDRAHSDAERELKYASQTRLDNLALARCTDETLTSIMARGRENMENLKGSIELDRFSVYLRQMYLWLINDWNLSRDRGEIKIFEAQLSQIMSGVGTRQFYSRFARGMFVRTAPTELLEISDRVYEELERKGVNAEETYSQDAIT